MIFIGPNGKPLMLGQNVVLSSQVAAPPPPPPVSGGAALPTTSLTRWWDASSLAAGTGTLSAKSPTTVAAVVPFGAKVMPRMCGTLPGYYSVGGAGSQSVRHPIVNDSSITSNATPVAAGQTLAIYLAWSRANLRQTAPGVLSQLPVSLLKIGTVEVLQLSAAGAVTLFPASIAATAGALSLRHTRGILVQFAAGKIDVWLDSGTQLFTNVTSEITLGATADLVFLENSQLIFHEAAVWNKALDATERTNTLSYFMRWPMGKRYAAHSLMIGQSNASNFAGSYLIPGLNTGIAYVTGNLSSNILWGGGTLAGTSFNAGQGIYDMTSPDRFLNPMGNGDDPSTWPLGTNGVKFMTAIDSMTADDRENVFSVVWYWSETDGQMLTPATKARYLAAIKRVFFLIRQRCGKTPATLPFMVISALPYVTDVGAQLHRECMADLINDPAQNVRMMLATAGDAIALGDTWDPATGLESGPSDGHRDYDGMLGFRRRMAIPIARAIVAAQAAAATPDVTAAINPAYPVTCGPNIASAVYEGGTSVLVTVVHDGGNDLSLPLRAVLGVGWVVMDGLNSTTPGSLTTFGPMIEATACAKVSATQLRLTLASAPAFPARSQLYYIFGDSLDPTQKYATVGRGNAVIDNFAAMPMPAGWDIAADLGAAEKTNNPLQATTYGIALT